MVPSVYPVRFRQYGTDVASAQMINGVLRLPHGFLGKYKHSLWFHPNYSLLEDFIERNVLSAGLDQVKEDFQVQDAVKETEEMEEDTETEDEEVQYAEWQLKVSQFHLVATPGIGKSYFGHYWFYKQAKLKKRVIWRTEGDRVFLYYDFSLPEPFLFSSNNYSVPDAWQTEMANIWLVVDGGCEGVTHDGPLLQCVSPGRSGYHEFSKDLGILCHLEAWTIEELKECRDKLQLPFTDVELEDRFYYCGGLSWRLFKSTISGTPREACLSRSSTS